MARTLRRATGGLVAIVLAASPLVAQGVASVDAGLAAAYFPADDREIAGPWLRAQAARDEGRLSGRVAGTVIAGTYATSGSLESAGAWRLPLGRIAALELEGEGSALFGERARASRSLLGGARLLRAVGDGGLWLRGTGHLAWREAGRLGGESAEAGAWWTLPGATLSLAVIEQRAQGQLFASAARGPVLGVVPVRYREASLSLSAIREWGTAEVAAGARRDRDAERLYQPSWRLSAARWLRPTTALVVGAEQQLPDFVRGGDGVVVLSVGLRLGARQPRPRPRRERLAAVVDLSPGGDGSPSLRVRAPRACTVEVMGDFSGWEPLALEVRAGAFVLARTLSPGTHRLLVRVDGGPWLPPANLATVDDDYGGRVGLVVVPDPG